MSKIVKTGGSSYSMRLPATESEYVKYQRSADPDKCPLCDGRKVLRRFLFWKIVENQYPYDLVSDVSHMLITRKHNLCWLGRNLAALELYLMVFPKLRRGGYYTVFLENLTRRKTVPGHAHWHLLQSD